MKNLILLRGVSGSGKTTIADLLCEMVINSKFESIEPNVKYKAPSITIETHCADDFFTDEEGNYKFQPAYLGNAHKDCRTRTEAAMIGEIPLVVVHNTFTKDWEMDPYFMLAEKYGYRIHTLIVENRHGSSSVHDVPPLALTNQQERFEIKL